MESVNRAPMSTISSFIFPHHWILAMPLRFFWGLAVLKCILRCIWLDMQYRDRSIGSRLFSATPCIYVAMRATHLLLNEWSLILPFSFCPTRTLTHTLPRSPVFCFFSLLAFFHIDECWQQPTSNHLEDFPQSLHICIFTSTLASLWAQILRPN